LTGSTRFEWRYRAPIRGFLYVLLCIVIALFLFGGESAKEAFARVISEPIAVFLFANKVVFFLCAILILLLTGRFRFIRLWVAGFGVISFIALAVWHKAIFRSVANVAKIASAVATTSNTARFKLSAIIIFCIAAYSIVYSSSRLLVVSGMAILLLLLIGQYVRRFCSLSKPARFFLGLQSQIEKHWGEVGGREIPMAFREWKSLEPSDPQYRKKRNEAMGALWFYNRFFYRTGNFLGHMENNRLLVAYFILTVGWTFLLTVAIFAFEYLGLVRMSPGSIQGLGNQSIWQAAYFSFTVITTTGFGDIIPESGLARGLVSAEVCCGILIAVILLLVFTTVTVDRYRRGLDSLSSEFLTRAEEIESLLRAETGQPTYDIVAELLASEEELKPGSWWYRFYSIDGQESTRRIP
jgi:hypothetical protein